MFDWNAAARAEDGSVQSSGSDAGRASRVGYAVFKRAFDIVGVLALMPVFFGVALFLVVVNPRSNPGPLFFRQDRMGRHCRPFQAWKFRSMVEAEAIDRGPFDALETHRITPLGRFLRRTRLDELPQVLNVLRGEMSLIGPRPDYLAHAIVYLREVPGYRERHAVRPGISGLAQVTHGYVDGLDGVHAKVAQDLRYIREASVATDLSIAWRTVLTVLRREGA